MFRSSRLDRTSGRSSRAGNIRGKLPPQDAPRRHAIWRRKLGDLRNALDHNVVEPTEPWSPSKQIVYIVDAEESRAGRGVAVDLAFRTANKSAQGWDRPRHLRMGRRQVSTLPDAIDRQIIQMLAGIGRSDYSSYYGSGDEIPRRYYLTDTSQDELLATICKHGALPAEGFALRDRSANDYLGCRAGLGSGSACRTDRGSEGVSPCGPSSARRGDHRH